jgi:hypothetical protein
MCEGDHHAIAFLKFPTLFLQVWGEAHGKPNVAFVFDSREHTTQLAPLWKLMNEQ